MRRRNTKYVAKELMCYGREACYCGHSGKAHQGKCYGVVGKNFEWDCKCKEYHPKDNLAYLEWKYEEKLKDGRNKNK